MKVTLKDLYNRVYEDKECIEFSYNLKDGDEVREKTLCKANFEKVEDMTWRMTILIPSSRVSETQIYSAVYGVPSQNIPLTTVCLMGIRLFYLQLNEELNLKGMMKIAAGLLTNPSFGVNDGE